jgi:hypothetical protein
MSIAFIVFMIHISFQVSLELEKVILSIDTLRHYYPSCTPAGSAFLVPPGWPGVTTRAPGISGTVTKGAYIILKSSACAMAVAAYYGLVTPSTTNGADYIACPATGSAGHFPWYPDLWLRVMRALRLYYNNRLWLLRLNYDRLLLGDYYLRLLIRHVVCSLSRLDWNVYHLGSDGSAFAANSRKKRQ